MNNRPPQNHGRLVVGVTVGASAFTLLRGQLAWFRQQGWDVTLVSAPDEQACRASARENVNLVGIPMRRTISPFRDIVALVRWIRILQTIRPEAINVGTPKASLLGTIAGKVTSVRRRIYLVRGLRIEGASGPKAIPLWLAERLTMAFATDVIFVSKSLTLEASRRHLFPVRKAWLIGEGSSNGVDAQAIIDRTSSVDRIALKRKLGIPQGEFVVGFVGRITQDKGVETILNALHDPSLDREIRAVFVGSVEDQTLGKAIEQLGDRIKLIPWTDDLWGCLPLMDILCLPTRREGFPNVVLEAAAAGIPTITTRATGAIDSVVHGKTGDIIEIDDSPALVQTLNIYNRDRTLGPRLGAAARTRATQDYSQHSVWTGLMEIITGNPSPMHAQRVTKEHLALLQRQQDCSSSKIATKTNK